MRSREVLGSQRDEGSLECKQEQCICSTLDSFRLNELSTVSLMVRDGYEDNMKSKVPSQPHSVILFFQHYLSIDLFKTHSWLSLNILEFINTSISNNLKFLLRSLAASSPPRGSRSVGQRKAYSCLDLSSKKIFRGDIFQSLSDFSLHLPK